MWNGEAKDVGNLKLTEEQTDDLLLDVLTSLPLGETKLKGGLSLSFSTYIYLYILMNSENVFKFYFLSLLSNVDGCLSENLFRGRL